MKDVARLKWIAGFDMESLISSVLRNGTALSMILILAGLAIQEIGKTKGGFGPNLHARSIPQLILVDLNQTGLPEFWPRLLLYLGVSALLLTPYIRVVASMIYFAYVDRSWKHAIFTGVVLVILTIGLLTDLV